MRTIYFAVSPQVNGARSCFEGHRQSNIEGGIEGLHERVSEGVILLLPLKLPGFGIELVPTDL